MSQWTPFDRNGKLRVVLYTDPWWKRLYARLRDQPLWHQTGYMTDDGVDGDGTAEPPHHINMGYAIHEVPVGTELPESYIVCTKVADESGPSEYVAHLYIHNGPAPVGTPLSEETK
jgi:hypothetical protein